MEIKAIIIEWLTDKGFDGLYAPGECACEIADLMPCGAYSIDCKAGHYMKDSGANVAFEFIIGEKE